MASSVLQNVSNRLQESVKAPGKKKSKAASAGKKSDALAPPAKNESGATTPREHADDSVEGGEKEHIKEVQKQIRNVTKKLNNLTKVDAIIKENPGVSLEDLVATRKINNDQKAQALKKPQLTAQLNQLEEQLGVYKRLDIEYEQLLAKEKESWEAAHQKELEKVREEAKGNVQGNEDKVLQDSLLTFSRFLRAAANRRGAGDENTDEARAFEAVLTLVYNGDFAAVQSAERLIKGTQDAVVGLDNVNYVLTFARVKELTLQETPEIDVPAESGDSTLESTQTDPTLAHATLNELQDPTTQQLVNGTSKLSLETNGAPAASSIDATAANAAADAQWDSTKSGAQEDPLSESFEVIPRDPAELDTPIAATAPVATQSWADEAAEHSASQSWTADSAATQNGTAPSSNDGFQEVTGRNDRPRGNRGFRGGDRGHRGRGRGSGFRGGERGRGRGRGRPRGD